MYDLVYKDTLYTRGHTISTLAWLRYFCHALFIIPLMEIV